MSTGKLVDVYAPYHCDQKWMSDAYVTRSCCLPGISCAKLTLVLVRMTGEGHAGRRIPMNDAAYGALHIERIHVSGSLTSTTATCRAHSGVDGAVHAGHLLQRPPLEVRAAPRERVVLPPSHLPVDGTSRSGAASTNAIFAQQRICEVRPRVEETGNAHVCKATAQSLDRCAFVEPQNARTAMAVPSWHRRSRALPRRVHEDGSRPQRLFCLWSSRTVCTAIEIFLATVVKSSGGATSTCSAEAADLWKGAAHARRE
eukprot:CAMPEP_0119364022 /NCGR_PEP_ID=MMETSP1334-20130426/10941_1 /TAXON_ID=127549 /ORGANISM="Calcidiscus leptoporus, Strain RCC1130" /LENGTH=256 /DNA_ID=CAMNT_0007379619 /DNA_START=706 /DNA_END=1475 /DNA_ORIENTATION=-